MADKLLAEWFWTDRWMGSSAFGLPMEARGLYREMLTQAWRRGAVLPADPTTIQRFTGCTPEEWARCWPKIAVYWKPDGDTIYNETQRLIYAETLARHNIYTERASKAAAHRWQGGKNASSIAQASPQALLEQCPPSPSPSPSPKKETPTESLSASADKAFVNSWLSRWNTLARQHGVPAVRSLNPGEVASLRAALKEAGNDDTLANAMNIAAGQYAKSDGKLYGLRNFLVRKNRGKWLDAARSNGHHPKETVLDRIFKTWDEEDKP